jgi:hypothetical protein
MFGKTDRQEKRVKKSSAGIILIILFILSSTGCIDMGLMDAVLPHNEKELPDYVITEKISISYQFNTSIPGTPSQLRKEFNDREFRILEDTPWMKIEITVNLDKNDLLQELLKLLGTNLSLTRHVKIVITDPKSRVWYVRDFFDTETMEPEMVYLPEPGIWTLDVEAKGVGGEVEGFQLYDSFVIKIFTYEPT